MMEWDTMGPALLIEFGDFDEYCMDDCVCGTTEPSTMPTTVPTTYDESIPAKCYFGGVTEDDECYFGDDNSYETMSCFQYLNGNDCGHEYPDDNAAGICNDTSQRYRICNTPDGGDDACAQMDITTVEDCALAVEGLIEDGVCDESGYFYSSLCTEDAERPSCVCHYAGSEMGDYTDTGHGNSVYRLLTNEDAVEEDDEDDNTLVIVGVVIGVVLVLIIFASVLFLMMKNRKVTGSVNAQHVSHTSTASDGLETR